ncbi:MAG: ThiF family adenylyltransferase [Candidatus Obscuribacterales bacterium]|nr:ThiF family adenylyltransferase [Candidatus Obscuribacterales bacterium]
MAHKLHHEQIFRGSDAMKLLASVPITICGAGALGSNLAVNLVRQGVSNLSVIDDDRVEPQNVGTQVYSLDDTGGLKAELLKNAIYRDVGEEIFCSTKRLTEKNVSKLLSGSELVIDAFDNSDSRRAVFDWSNQSQVACLHIGLNNQYGELRWNETYMVPSNAGDDVCDYPLARNLVLLVTALASELIVRYVLEGTRKNISVTLGDLSINHDD